MGAGKWKMDRHCEEERRSNPENLLRYASYWMASGFVPRRRNDGGVGRVKGEGRFTPFLMENGEWRIENGN
jgi:hypothetical protein